MFEHIGFPSLERYPNTFFVEQLAHLEQALAESTVSAISNKPKEISATFEETLPGKLHKWMKGHSQWKTYSLMGEYMGKTNKHAKKYVQEISSRGIFCERRMTKNVMEIRIL